MFTVLVNKNHVTDIELCGEHQSQYLNQYQSLTNMMIDHYQQVLTMNDDCDPLVNLINPVSNMLLFKKHSSHIETV